MSERFHQFDYDCGIALVWHLDSGRSPVVIDPRVSFGAPSVSGVPTWTLKGRWDAGESVAEIREDFGLSEEEVDFGLRFEGVDLDDAPGRLRCQKTPPIRQTPGCPRCCSLIGT